MAVVSGNLYSGQHQQARTFRGIDRRRGELRRVVVGDPKNLHTGRERGLYIALDIRSWVHLIVRIQVHV